MENNNGRGLILLWAGLTLILLAAICYFSWVPNPRMQAIWWIPRWLAKWADVHGEVRTAIPFIALGAVLGAGCRRLTSSAAWLAAIWGGLCLAATGIELVQLNMPTRTFDPADIAYAAAGSALGIALAAIVFPITSRSAPHHRP